MQSSTENEWNVWYQDLCLQNFSSPNSSFHYKYFKSHIVYKGQESCTAFLHSKNFSAGLFKIFNNLSLCLNTIQTCSSFGSFFFHEKKRSSCHACCFRLGVDASWWPIYQKYEYWGDQIINTVITHQLITLFSLLHI